MQEKNCDAAKNLACKYYGDKNLKKRDVRPTKLVDFEGISKHYNVNIMLYEPKKDRGKDAGSVWWLVYGKIQHKNDLPTINIGLLGGHCFTLRRWMCFVSDRNVRGVGRYLRETKTSQYILRRKNVLEEKQKSSVQEVNLSTS